MAERTYAKRLAESRKNMSADAIRRAKNERCKLRNAKRKAERLAVVAERQVAWDSLTPTQKLVELDKRLGKGVGAKKQRAKLATVKPVEETKPKKRKGKYA